MPTLTRRAFAAQALGGSVAAALSAAPSHPNIVFIMLDDLGPADVGCYGSKEIQTPNIDRLASEGLKFTQAYAGCTVCAPARSTLMTGTHMGHTPVRSNSGGAPIRAADITIAQVLKKAGYVCGGFGKWGLGDIDTSGVPERHGFDRFYGYYHQVHAHYYYPDYLIDTGRKVPLPGNKGFYRGNPKPGAFPTNDPATGQKRQFTGYLIFDEMKKFIRENQKKPFFCYAPWTIPHGRYELPEDDPAWQLYRDKPWSMEARVHAAFTTMADRMVGETSALLRDLGLEQNTLLVFCSDNGAPKRFEGELDSAGIFRGQKTNMYEGGLAVPFIARWPGRIAAGKTTKALTYFPDMMPTLAEIAGAQQYLPQGVDGIPIAAHLMGKGDVDANRTLYWEWNGAHFAKTYEPKMQACRRGKWKLVRNDDTKPWELYDLSQDRAERNEIAASNPKEARELEAWIRANRTDPPPQVEPDKPEGQRWR